MCLILFAYQVHPTYDLIVAANRDEFYQRPTASAHFWEDAPYILAGRDLEKMGTWMGVTKTGRFAALTNYRNPQEVSEGKRSRGELVANFLKKTTSASEYMGNIADDREHYPGYNLLTYDGNSLHYYSNIENKVQPLKPGIYGVSNHLLNTKWPKVEKGIEGMHHIICSDEKLVKEPFFRLLQNADPAPDEKLPKTGVTLEWERLLSPLFIQSENYGTRCSTLIMMNKNKIELYERVFEKNEVKDQQFKITVESK